MYTGGLGHTVGPQLRERSACLTGNGSLQLFLLTNHFLFKEAEGTEWSSLWWLL